MGLERIAAVLQGKHNNYDIDLFRALIEAVAHETGVDPDGPQSASHKVIADHLRTTSFLIADGVLPSNEGRGYVLRRIMRRAMRHAHILGAQDPMVYKLVPTLVHEMGDAYPELVRAQPLITETLKLEEGRFKKTLGTGLKLLEDETKGLSAGGTLKGDVAFKLYDTFGFPLDLTQDVLRARDIKVDTAGFEKAMDEQRAKARAAWAGSGETADQAIWFDVRQKVRRDGVPGLRHRARRGPDQGDRASTARRSPSLEGRPDRLDRRQPDAVLCRVGRPAGRHRPLRRRGDGEAAIADVHKMVGDLHAHHATVEKGAIKVGDDVVMTVDPIRRAQLRAHHSATHLLHEALRRHLGTHVTQKGSLVAPDRLRFDISHTKPMSAEELRAVEDEVNERIRQNSSVDTRLMTPEEAIAAGAMALFGEKYGDEVRVLSMGEPSDGAGPTRSSCAAAPMRCAPATSACSSIVGEGAVASGVRRIEALTGQRGRGACPPTRIDLLDEAASVMKVRGRGSAGARAGADRRRSAGSSASWPRRARRWRWRRRRRGAAAADEVREVGGIK